MAYLVGFDGSLDLGGHGGSIRRWSAKHTRVVSEVPGFADTGMRRRLGMPDMQGSASGSMMRDVASSSPKVAHTNRDGVSMTLYASSAATACSYAGTFVMTEIGQEVDKLGESALTYDFALSGGSAVTETWDES